MKKFLVWDLPTRLFHWAFTASISLSFIFALTVGEHSPLFQLHMVFGIVAVFLLVLRVAYGIFGSRHARFRNFPIQPIEIARYFVGVITGQAKKYAGHNPGSALAALAMFALVPSIVVTGLGGGEAFEDVHEVLAYFLLGVIGAHLLGIVLYSLRHHENISAAMIDGKKPVSPEEAIASSHPLWGSAFAGAALAWIITLFSGHDAQAATVRLPIIGTVVQLGENTREEHASGDRVKTEKHTKHERESAHRDNDD